MGVSQIKMTAEKLIAKGRDPKTPVAAIHKGTTPEQRTEMTDLESLSEKGIGLSPPVIFVVGPVAHLHDELDWFEKKLARVRGKKVVLTGIESHGDENKSLLESYGMEVILMPLIETVDREFSLPDINDFDALVFTSQEGIKKVENLIDLGSYKGTIYAIGPKTQAMLKTQDVRATTGDTYNSQGLADHICNTLSQGSRILALRSSAATDVLEETLGGHYEYTEISVYDIKRRPVNVNNLSEGDVIFVMSASCAKSLSEVPSEDLSGKYLVSIGPETSKYIPQTHIEAKVHTFQGMIDAYLDHLWRKNL
jgi:uroporphyrinogen III methyltransferase/synthase